MGFISIVTRLLLGISLSMTIVPFVVAINEEFAPDDIVIRDVCILGGGSTGTYAAIRLKDKAKSVVVVEQNKLLGGHTETLYLGHEQYINYGVEGVFNDELSRNYLKRLGVDHKPLLPSTLTTEYVNFRTGKKVPPPSGIPSTVEAATMYRAAIEKFSYLKDGLYNLPTPIPEELLKSFGHFVETAGIQGALQVVKIFAHGAGNLLHAPLLRVLQLCGLRQIDSLLHGGYITPTHGMYEVYKRASEILGPDVLYQTIVIEAERSELGIKIVVQSENGVRKLIKAKQLLVTFVPVMEFLDGFDLATTESSLFQKWDWVNYYVAVVKNTGIPNAVTLVNADPDNTPGNLPLPPFQLELQYSGIEGYLVSKVIGNRTLTAQQAKDLVLSDIRRMGTAGTFPGGDPEIVVFGDHTPTTVSVSSADVRDGFYRKLYALQGTKNTFYTGLAFCSDYSSLLWAYTDTIIQEMMSSSTSTCSLCVQGQA
ncbi:FAD dependent oxidoreductase [Aspergillus bombycis]|uniref:FAD dependent oxidoreductase n=1 Tax=Aspergillus bombycis TaxID=109264 RepID=A0A1F8ADK9_9EURO|nr:FAD dependent oxidoreductase [Aspergillus bombycis]OGM49813.1 FAD dependent oxidoreductase [Aspergillus bombycis]